MANTGRIVGKDCYVTFKGTAIHGDFTSFGYEQSHDLADVTAGADTYHYFIPVRDGAYTIDMEAFYDASGSAVWDCVKPGNYGTLIIGPYGTVATRPKWTWNRVVVASRGVAIPFAEGVTESASFQVSSALTEGTW